MPEVRLAGRPTLAEPDRTPRSGVWRRPLELDRGHDDWLEF